MKEIDEKTIKVNSYIKKNLSAGRYAHSVRVAKYAMFLATLSDKTKKLKKLAYFTGLAHDICKEIPNEKQIELAKKDGELITDIELQRPILLHGRSGAVFINKEFGINNKDVLNAIKNHTFGSTELKKLGKIVFIADKIEPGRKNIMAVRLRKMAPKLSLNELALRVVQWNITRLRCKGLKPSPATIAMEKDLVKKLKRLI